MDHVSANKMLNNVQEREHVSGLRVFDGEDQGKFNITLSKILTYVLGAGNRYKM